MSDPIGADVVIVGSGVAGSLIAWRLAEAKLKVLMLEAGPRIERVEAFKSYLAAADKNASAPYPPTPERPGPVSRDVHARCWWLNVALGRLSVAIPAE